MGIGPSCVQGRIIVLERLIFGLCYVHSYIKTFDSAYSVSLSEKKILNNFNIKCYETRANSVTKHIACITLLNAFINRENCKRHDSPINKPQNFQFHLLL
jgi:hypothetical protein